MKYDVIRSYWPAPIYSDGSTLDLDFTTGTMPTAVTFTRADSTALATFIDASGYVKTVASAGDPRFDYTGGVAKGLLIEASATNIFSQSNDWTISPWGGPAQITWDGSTTATAPDGVSAAKQITVTSGSSASISQFVASGTDRSLSVWIKAGSLNSFSIGIFNPADAWGTGGTNTASIISGPGSLVQQVGSLWSFTGLSQTQWTRVQLFRSVASTAILAYPGSSSGSITGTAYLWGAQLESGTQASSLIPTTTASLTRLADDAVIRSTAWTSLYAQPGAMVVEFYRGAYGVGDRSIMSTDPTAARHWHLKNANASATAQIAFSTGSPVTQTGLIAGLNKVAIAWNAPTPTASFDLCVNGATPTFGGSNVGTTLSTWLTLGSQSTTGVSGSGTWDGYINNSIKSVKYYNALTYAEMQAKTT